jgi:hypothetical protein
MRTRQALDWLNFLIADVQGGVGPFLAIYLLASRHPRARRRLHRPRVPRARKKRVLCENPGDAMTGEPHVESEAPNVETSLAKVLSGSCQDR